ncbi:MAG: hypothetical protein AB4911_16620 [Oscillochloridaceae bacterium umkhey_bin13]
MKRNLPEGERYAYFGIIGMTALLCFAWLLTGSLALTLIIIVLGLLHLAPYFPNAETIVAEDPLLLWLRRLSPLIVIIITLLAVALRSVR